MDDLNDEDELDNKNLVPSFVFPGKKPNYASQFERTLMILESVDISDEDMCLMGNVRVNFANLQMAAAGRKRVTIVAKYSKDDWKTARETKAMIVKAQTHPALSHLMTKAMRFYIGIYLFWIMHPTIYSWVRYPKEIIHSYLYKISWL